VRSSARTEPITITLGITRRQWQKWMLEWKRDRAQVLMMGVRLYVYPLVNDKHTRSASISFHCVFMKPIHPASVPHLLREKNRPIVIGFRDDPR
jgi:hypothetical protein